MQLQSCTDSTGTSCRVLGEWGGPETIARPGPVVLGPAEEGRWLQAIERIFGTPDPRLRSPAVYIPPEQRPAWRLTGSMTTWSAGPSGLIEPAPVTPPPVDRTPVRPAPARRTADARVSVARRLRAGRPLLVATVRCRGACRVRVTLTAGRRRVVLTHADRRSPTMRFYVGR